MQTMRVACRRLAVVGLLTIALWPGQSSAQPADSSAYNDGLADRTAWEAWIARQTGERDGRAERGKQAMAAKDHWGSLLTQPSPRMATQEMT